MADGLIPEIDKEAQQSDERHRTWFTFQNDDSKIVPYHQHTSKSISNDDFQLQPQLIQVQETDEGELKDHLKFEDNLLSPADHDNLDRGMSPPNHLM